MSEPDDEGRGAPRTSGGGGKAIRPFRTQAPIVPITLVVCIALLVACAQLFSNIGPEKRYERTAVVEVAGDPLGAEECSRCHGHQPAPKHHGDCESCHGSGGAHVQNVFAEEYIRFPDAGDCLDCHGSGKANHVDWATSDHDTAGLLCSDCHDPHNMEPRHLRKPTPQLGSRLASASPATQLCADCHPAVTARLNMPSHHPIREGMMDCSDCHSPHGSIEGDLGSQNERCESCHQTQTGPFVYEHLPVVEDCNICHAPHGASAQDLLRATQPGVCSSCHTIAELGATHDAQAYVTRCTDCHGAVHGSHADPHLRR